MRIPAIVALLSFFIGPSTYDAANTENWRARLERELRSETGWLTLAGLTFLEVGRNTIGSDPSSDVVLPAGSPKVVGVLVREETAVWFEPADGTELTLNGSPLTSRVPLTAQDRVTAGAVSFHPHKSGDRLAVRIRDANSERRRTFAGLRWFPIRDPWRIRGRFVAYPSSRTIKVPNVVGDYEELSIPGEVVFNVRDKEVRLQAAQSGRRLWFIFSDGLSGRETYRIRFLYAEAPDAEGRVTLDFNRAHNPPCAYNPYTTCPLPPAQNRLRIVVDAGERVYSARSASAGAMPRARRARTQAASRPQRSSSRRAAASPTDATPHLSSGT